QVPHGARRAVEVDIDLLVIEKEFVHEGAVGECRDGEAKRFRADSELGGTRPAWTHFDEGLGERQGRRICAQPRTVEHQLGLSVGGKRGGIDVVQPRTGDIQVNGACATVVAGNDRAAGRKRAHARELPILVGDGVHQRVDVACLYGLGDDPDAPRGTWVHWVVYNIDPKVTKIEESSQPFGTVGKNTGGQESYMGPCPPDREHRYFFKLYALDTRLKLGSGATKEELLKSMEGHILAESQLMGRYVKS
ncbi:MAG: hypothetical protein K1000chlam4_01005, partial [Chlamydiae bacterium]|nr:hypothetical protein [Chlamydiota bacterium]